MDWGVFISSVAAAVILLGIMPPRWLQKIPFLGTFMGRIFQVFGSRSKALSLFTLFLTLIILVQQTTNYQHGIVYQLATDNMQNRINSEQGLTAVFENQEVAVGIGYWLLAFCILVSLVALIRGGKSKEENEILSTTKDLARRMTLLENGLTNTHTGLSTLHNDITDMKNEMKTEMRNVVKAIQEREGKGDGDRPD